MFGKFRLQQSIHLGLAVILVMQTLIMALVLPTRAETNWAVPDELLPIDPATSELRANEALLLDAQQSIADQL